MDREEIVMKVLHVRRWVWCEPRGFVMKVKGDVCMRDRALMCRQNPCGNSEVQRFVSFAS